MFDMPALLDNLEKQLTRADLPLETRKLADNFFIIFTRIKTEFNASSSYANKIKHLATLYGLAKLHVEQVYKVLEYRQSAGAYVASYAYSATNPDYTYYKALLDITETLSSAFKNHISTKGIVKVEGCNESLSYKAGDSLEGNLGNAPRTFSEFEDRVFITTFFEELEQGAKRSIKYANGADVLTSALLFGVFNLPGLAVGLGLSKYGKPAPAKVQGEIILRSLARNEFKPHLAPWTKACNEALSEHTEAEKIGQLPNSESSASSTADPAPQAQGAEEEEGYVASLRRFTGW